MIDKKKLLEEVYKYYDKYSTDEVTTMSKQYLRQKKIKAKGALKEQKIFTDIIGEIKEYAIVDWNDEDACCYEFKILLHKNQNIMDDDKRLIEKLGGTRNDLRVFISVLEPYYYLFLEETKYYEINNHWTFRTIEVSTPEEGEIVNKIDACLLQRGYEKLTSKDVKIIIPDIETELLYIGEVKVFNCLFTDLLKNF